MSTIPPGSVADGGPGGRRVGEAGMGASGTGLVTAEAVELEIPTASVGLRGLAIMVDVIVLGIVGIAMFFGLSLVLSSVVTDEASAEAAIWVVIVTVVSMAIVVPTVIEATTRGRSAGKVIAKLRVVTVEAGPVGWSHAAIRATAGAFELLGTGGLLALLVALLSPRGQRLGDMVAGTLVVREAVSRTDIRPVRFTPVHGTADLVAALDVADLDDADYQVMRSTLLRDGLDPARHAQLCGMVVRQLWPRASRLPLPTSIPAPAVLTAMAAAYQDQHAPADGAWATDWVWASRT